MKFIDVKLPFNRYFIPRVTFVLYIESRSLSLYIYVHFYIFFYRTIGFLDLSSESEDLKPGTKLELPLWLAQPLNKVNKSIVSVDIPKMYKEGYRYVYVAALISIEIKKGNFLTTCFAGKFY